MNLILKVSEEYDGIRIYRMRWQGGVCVCMAKKMITIRKRESLRDTF